MDYEWRFKTFYELTNEDLYKILQLRIEVFSLEQNVIYQDCDDKDFESYHLMAFADNKLAAYCRILPAGIAYANAASIGRVVTSPLFRKQNLGKLLVIKSLKKISALFGDTTVVISAQLYLQKFYENFSFIAEGKPYLEDDIPHIKMTLEKAG